ncbi:hypothetical protein K6U06_16865 [Acidiferrimicrobium sp. IK]|uniref:hypothetical protein n=1 Tax=Acidiferrimicrobium sp. IK TaxID=2871700 RepID=UPI0021CB6E18|nr:hypothetical protein [Acidiferrimicrobium sp. IK]MCU4186043.1 hypothetical protein [Acidiferrimicrobium sp. IK]
MSGVRTEFEFVLPRGYVDESGALHRKGTMRLATARDELQPLRDPTIMGPDDPRLTILVLARVIRTLGTITLVTPNEIEGLFAADLAYLQDFYGVVNFGTDADIDALLAAQQESLAPAAPPPAAPAPPAEETAESSAAASAPYVPLESDRPGGRRAAIQEVPSTTR